MTATAQMVQDLELGREPDLIVVGAGPAGLACTVTAARGGARVLLVDAGLRIGGQFWRHGAPGYPSARGEGHHDWRTFTALRDELAVLTAAGRVRHLPQTHAWMAQRTGDEGFAVHLVPSSDAAAARTPEGILPHRSVMVAAPMLALCTGAYDRQLPIPGWDLPGVMAAGGLQAFIKGNGFVPGKQVVVGGTGPFLMSVAAGAVHAGAQVAAVCEANSPVRWLPRARQALASPEKLAEGAEYAATFARHHVPYQVRRMVTRALGTERLEAVETMRVDAAGRGVPGTVRRIDCDLLALGWGFTPMLELPLALGARTRIDADGSLVVVADAHGRTSVPGLFVAGEVTGVGGAAVAVEEGRGLGAAVLGGEAPEARLRRLHALRAFAAAMHEAYPVPRRWHSHLEDDTLICRCEEVPAHEVRRSQTALAGADVRSIKSFTRAGMGWCQGRECGFAAACLSSSDPARPDPSALRAGSVRPMSAPVTLGALTHLDPPGDDTP